MVYWQRRGGSVFVATRQGKGHRLTTERNPHEVLQIDPAAPWSSVREAYWTLARRYHPDGSAPDHDRMAELNAAYEQLERRRAAESRERVVPVGPGSSASWAAPNGAGNEPSQSESGPAASAVPPTESGGLLQRMEAARTGASPTIDFGEYAGWRIADVAAYDPNYLRGLSRHSGGVRYRSAIEQALSEQERGR